MGPRPFRFDVDLCEIPGFDDRISGWWKELEADGWEGYKFRKKLKGLKMKIRERQKVEDERGKNRKEELLQSLQSMETNEDTNPLNPSEKEDRIRLKEEYEEIIRREEIRWQQKSRATWLREGDHNCKFFHRMANVGKRINAINCLKMGDNLVEDGEEIKNLIISFFAKLYCKEYVWRPKVEGLNFRSISRIQAADLERAFNVEEGEAAIFSMS
ncbi:uncharacterized protein LOC143855885 [Tasmannia lanceolata]|uniref:uncharacterized protein LOC143855885 n=1 Tax=Tasmannia lanceolata TaxID=3420 RepID=UPI0040648C43